MVYAWLLIEKLLKGNVLKIVCLNWLSVDVSFEWGNCNLKLRENYV